MENYSFYFWRSNLWPWKVIKINASTNPNSDKARWSDCSSFSLRTRISGISWETLLSGLTDQSGVTGFTGISVRSGWTEGARTPAVTLEPVRSSGSVCSVCAGVSGCSADSFFSLRAGSFVTIDDDRVTWVKKVWIMKQTKKFIARNLERRKNGWFLNSRTRKFEAGKLRTPKWVTFTVAFFCENGNVRYNYIIIIIELVYSFWRSNFITSRVKFGLPKTRRTRNLGMEPVQWKACTKKNI